MRSARSIADFVDVIEWRASGNQCPHDFSVTEMRGRDQRRAVIDAGDRFRIAPPSSATFLLPNGQALGNNNNIIRYGEPTSRYPDGYFRSLF